MNRATSPSSCKPYGLALVSRVWHIARSTVYAQRCIRELRDRGVAVYRRGPMGPCDDATLVSAIRDGSGSISIPRRGLPQGLPKTYGVDLTLATNTGSLAKTGYSFSGWNTQADGSGTDYAAGGTYAANAAVTLYAKWTINTYTPRGTSSLR